MNELMQKGGQFSTFYLLSLGHYYNVIICFLFFFLDLTNFPPPGTPDDDSMLDFTESNFPPPIFSSNSSLASWNKNESGTASQI